MPINFYIKFQLKAKQKTNVDRKTKHNKSVMNTASMEYPELNNFFSYHCRFLRKTKRDNFRADTQFILANLYASPQSEVNGLSTPVLNIHLCLTQRSAECPIIRYEGQMDCQGHILGPGPITQWFLVRFWDTPQEAVPEREELWVLAHCPTQDQCIANVPLILNWKEGA